MKKINSDLQSRQRKFKQPDRNVSREFQVYGYELAKKLGDLRNKSLYIKLAKELPRNLLEQAYSFVADYRDARSKGKLFMYRLGELKKDKEGRR